MKISIAPYLKAVTAVIGLALTYLTQYYGTNHWVVLAIAIASALGVYAVPNSAKPPVLAPSQEAP